LFLRTTRQVTAVTPASHGRRDLDRTTLPKEESKMSAPNAPESVHGVPAFAAARAGTIDAARVVGATW
jgi:hypothetical protein